MTNSFNRLAAVIAVSGAALAGGSAVASALPHGVQARCNPLNSHTLASDSQARVYSVKEVVYGCAYSNGKRWRLGTTGFCQGAKRVGAVRLAGALAGYGVQTCGTDFATAAVVVRSLTDGKQLLSEPATQKSTGAESFQSVGSVALKADGSVAWIGVSQSIISSRRTIEVRKVENGAQTLLDSGRAIKPASLQLQGSTLTWKHGQSLRTATLS